MSRQLLWLDLALAVLLVALALPTRLEVGRAYTAATAGQGTEALQSEERLYNRYAVPWAKGEGAWPRDKEFPWHPLGSFTHRPPAYALFLGLVYRAAGSENFAAVRGVQAWLDTLLVLLVYAAGVLAFEGMVRSGPQLSASIDARKTTRVDDGNRWIARAIGFTAALAVARYDFLEQLTARVLSETLFTFLGVAFLATAFAATRPDAGPRRRTLGVLLAGYVLGWANLTRPFLLPAALAFPVWVALSPGLGSKFRQRLSPALVAVLGLTLAILPVTIRNWQFHHELILISSNSGFTVFNSVLGAPGLSHPEALGSEDDVDALNLGELAEQAEFRRRALDYLRSYPEDWPRIFGAKVHTLVASAEGHKISHVLLATPNDAWLYPLVLVGALISLLVFPRVAWHPRLLLFIVAASQFGTSLLTKAELRYRVPIVPVLALATAWAAWAILVAVGGLVVGRARHDAPPP